MTVHSSYCVFYVAIFINHSKWLGCKEKMKKKGSKVKRNFIFLLIIANNVLILGLDTKQKLLASHIFPKKVNLAKSCYSNWSN